MSGGGETLEFQAETRQLLHLVVHSLYSNKDIFLRELISNASDALDKLRLESLQDSDLAADTTDLHIEIQADKDARTLTVRDNGIGMSRDEVVDLIGTPDRRRPRRPAGHVRDLEPQARRRRSLNVSRELLQHDRHIRRVRRRLVKKVLATAKDLRSDDPEKYRGFFDGFGRALKEGLLEDTENRETLLDLLLQATEFDGVPLRSIAKGQVDLDAPDEEAGEDAEPKPQPEQFAALLSFLTETLGEQIKEARISQGSPCLHATDHLGRLCGR